MRRRAPQEKKKNERQEEEEGRNGERRHDQPKGERKGSSQAGLRSACPPCLGREKRQERRRSHQPKPARKERRRRHHKQDFFPFSVFCPFFLFFLFIDSVLCSAFLSFVPRMVFCTDNAISRRPCQRRNGQGKATERCLLRGAVLGKSAVTAKLARCTRSADSVSDDARRARLPLNQACSPLEAGGDAPTRALGAPLEPL